MACHVMCSEKVLRLLRLFFVLILGWFMGLSAQEENSGGLYSSEAIARFCCLRL